MQESEIQLNGFQTMKNSYFWCGALDLAWDYLKKQIIKEDIKVASGNKNVLKVVNNFNRCPFTKADLSEDSYYIRAGHGNQTAKLISKEMKNKSAKQTPAFQSLPNQAIIVFAYLSKNIKFKHPFSKKEFVFNGTKTQGFCAATLKQRKQVFVHQYENSANFILSLKIQSQDQLFLMITEQKLSAKQVSDKMMKINGEGKTMHYEDIFQMPCINISHKRNVKSLNGLCLENKQFQEYFFQQVSQIVELEMNSDGAQVEKEEVEMVESQPRRFIFNKEFWLILRKQEKHPYLIYLVNEVGVKKQEKREPVKNSCDCSIY